MALFLPKLKYEMDALEPFLSKNAVDIHYNKHFANYVNTANTLIKDTIYADKGLKEIVGTAVGPIYNNAAQALNHEFFFNCLSPNKPLMPSRLAEALKAEFGSTDAFREQFINSAVGNFGSGWTWLTINPVTKKLAVQNTSNAGNPLNDGLEILLCIDVWEHAYYLDYQNRRKDYVLAFMEYVDWEFVQKNFDTVVNN